MGEQEKPPVESNSMQRVKVYRTNVNGKWDDQGTGHVAVDYLERSEELGLFVIDEEDNETLLFHRISQDDIYRKQDDTIISWKDPEFSSEIALSFQETAGCSYIWDQICDAQRNLSFSTLSYETYHSDNRELLELPVVELSTLPLLLKTVVECGVADQMHIAELILQDQVFLQKLMDLFRACEALEDTDGLHLIFKIVSGIILLNNTQILEKIFSEEFILDIMGCLEYDPGIPQVQRHREFLKEHVVFKEVIPIKDPVIISKIHQTHRVGYVKDVILAQVLDDATVANFNSIMNSNNAIVVSLLKDDSTFIQELFSRLRSSETSIESKKTLVLFMHEFCSLSKSLQMVQQHRLFRDLVNEGIFDVISDVLQSQDRKLVLQGTDILMLFLNQDPTLLRSYVSRQEGIPLLGLLVKGMITDIGDDMHCQYLEVLRRLLDPNTPQRDTVIEIFYEKHLGQLVDVITSSCRPTSIQQSVCEVSGSSGNQMRTKPEVLLNICELLCFGILHHPRRIKSNFLQNNTIGKVLLLTHRKEKYLVVGAVRFLRSLVSRSDEYVMNHIIKNNLFKPIIEVFVSNGSRYNLLNSAVLDLFHYIRKENLKALLKYLIDSFWHQLVKFENLEAVHSLKVKYDQLSDNSGTESSLDVLASRNRMDERALEKEEEDYFNEGSDEEDSSSASKSGPLREQTRPVLSNGSAPICPSSLSSPRSGGLGGCDDDDDDEDYKPPPRKQRKLSDEDEETLDAFRLKRNIASKSESELKRNIASKNRKAKGSLFATLCSTLSQAVLPGVIKANNVHVTVHSPRSEEKESDKEPMIISPGSCRSPDEKKTKLEKEATAAPRSCCSDSLQNAAEESGEMDGEDRPLLMTPPNSSSEMTVNGS